MNPSFIEAAEIFAVVTGCGAVLMLAVLGVVMVRESLLRLWP